MIATTSNLKVSPCHPGVSEISPFSSLKEVEQKINSLMGDFVRAHQYANQGQELVGTLSKKLEEIGNASKSQIYSLNQEHDNQISQLKEKHSNEMCEEKEKYKKLIEMKQVEIDKVSNDLKQRNSQYEKLNMKKEELEKEVEQQKKDLDGSVGSFNTLQNSYAELKERKEAVEQALKQFTDLQVQDKCQKETKKKDFRIKKSIKKIARNLTSCCHR